MSKGNASRANKIGVSAENPHDRLMAAISILQAYLLAQDSALIAEELFGHLYIEGSGIEHVIRILIDLLDVVDNAVTEQGA